MDFDRIWLKVELGENFDTTLLSCLEKKFKDSKSLRGAPQNAVNKIEGKGGGFDNHNRGRESFSRKNADMGETVQNSKLKKNLTIKGEDYYYYYYYYYYWIVSFI